MLEKLLLRKLMSPLLPRSYISCMNTTTPTWRNVFLKFLGPSTPISR
jgi:hypothetical protein